jgi:hypothetical protein
VKPVPPHCWYWAAVAPEVGTGAAVEEVRTVVEVAGRAVVDEVTGRTVELETAGALVLETGVELPPLMYIGGPGTV